MMESPKGPTGADFQPFHALMNEKGTVGFSPFPLFHHGNLSLDRGRARRVSPEHPILRGKQGEEAVCLGRGRWEQSGSSR